MVEWFLPSRRDVPGHGGGETVALTSVPDPVGTGIRVQTRRLVEMETWETTLAPEDAPDPDGPDAVIFASCDSVSEAVVAHAQAVELVAEALSSTVRRPQPEVR